ncbi:MAG: F0F1 ATP synthase subunit B [Azospirillaceae bacterium]
MLRTGFLDGVLVDADGPSPFLYLPAQDTQQGEDAVPGDSPGDSPGEGLIAEVDEAEDAAHAEGFFELAETWVAAALIILVVIVFRPAARAITAMLDKRADQIRHDLDEAQKLREEAQAALASYQRKQRDAIEEAEQIIAHAREEAGRIKTQAMADLDQSLKRREAQAMDRIAQAEVNATAEVRGMAVDVAIAATREIIAKQLKDQDANRLIDQSIEGLSGKLH